MEYKKNDAQDIEFLVAILGEDRVFSADTINEDFSLDEMDGISGKPDVLVEVASTDEVSKIMKLLFLLPIYALLQVYI